ncbi:MAG: glycoside hydrolase family 28 protein, partial [Muribaculum sp.]|nr:glycoside hydrolase family 28 protein [Muribaculum sp.]
MRHSSLLTAFALAAMQATGISAATVPADYEFASMYEAIPFEMEAVQRPVIPEYEVSITDFGGINDGHTKNTVAFAAAMKHLSEKGGGKLVVPAGIWYTGPIVFESNINLHLMSGALILFSSDRDDYPLIDSYFEGNSTKRCQSPLSANGKENVAITGLGTINGNGSHWRPVK